MKTSTISRIKRNTQKMMKIWKQEKHQNSITNTNTITYTNANTNTNTGPNSGSYIECPLPLDGSIDKKFCMWYPENLKHGLLLQDSLLLLYNNKSLYLDNLYDIYNPQFLSKYEFDQFLDVYVNSIQFAGSIKVNIKEYKEYKSQRCKRDTFDNDNNNNTYAVKRKIWRRKTVMQVQIRIKK